MSAKEWFEITLAAETRKRDLKLSGNEVNKKVEEAHGALPSSLWKLASLIKLEISSLPALQILPIEIGNFVELKVDSSLELEQIFV
jgi:hypothetical protein